MITFTGTIKFLILAILLSYFTPYSIISYFFDPKNPSTYLNIARYIFSRMGNQESKENIDWKNAKSIYEFSALDINGNYVNLSKYEGQVCLIVNVACKCGLTDTNYKQLQDLYAKHCKEGFSVLAFPSNQFMQVMFLRILLLQNDLTVKCFAKKEPGNEKEIKEFIQNYKVDFDVFSKININGDDAHPLYKYLKHKQSGTFVDAIKWNFSKFLINRHGQPVERYGPNVEPKDIEKDIIDLLKEK